MGNFAGHKLSWGGSRQGGSSGPTLRTEFGPGYSPDEGNKFCWTYDKTSFSLELSLVKDHIKVDEFIGLTAKDLKKCIAGPFLNCPGDNPISMEVGDLAVDMAITLVDASKKPDPKKPGSTVTLIKKCMECKDLEDIKPYGTKDPIAHLFTVGGDELGAIFKVFADKVCETPQPVGTKLVIRGYFLCIKKKVEECDWRCNNGLASFMVYGFGDGKGNYKSDDDQDTRKEEIVKDYPGSVANRIEFQEYTANLRGVEFALDAWCAAGITGKNLTKCIAGVIDPYHEGWVHAGNWFSSKEHNAKKVLTAFLKCMGPPSDG